MKKSKLTLIIIIIIIKKEIYLKIDSTEQFHLYPLLSTICNNMLMLFTN